MVLQLVLLVINIFNFNQCHCPRCKDFQTVNNQEIVYFLIKSVKVRCDGWTNQNLYISCATKKYKCLQ